VVYNRLWYRNLAYSGYSLLSQTTICLSRLSHHSFFESMGEQWAETLVQLATEPLDVAKKIHTAPLNKDNHIFQL